jgi:GNAT superfamily N-acetyltransferase
MTTIREARTDELEALGRLMVAVYSTLPGFPGPTEQPRYYELLAGIGRLSGTPATQLLVAVADDKLLGGIVYFSDMARYGAGGTASAERESSAFRLLAVDPAARGLGVGKALATHCIDLARAHHHRQVIIHTTAAMKVAWSMYEHLGFTRSPDLDFMQESLPVFGFRLALENPDPDS